MPMEDSPDSVERYNKVRRAAGKTEVKVKAWEEFRQAMEKDFHVASKFWEIIWHLRSSAEKVWGEEAL